MPTFIYRARARDGASRDGTVDAPDRRVAVSILSRQGLIPVSLTQGEDKKSHKTAQGVTLVLSRKKRLNMRQILVFTTELSDLLSSGMTLGNALNCLASREEQGVREAIISGLRDEIVQGKSLSDALEQFPDSFTRLYVNMVRAGEASGAIDEVLVRLVDHYERVMDMREKTISAMVYPVIVLVMGIGVMFFAMFFVLPKFKKIFDNMGDALPFSTQMLMNSSSWMLKYGPFLLVGIIVAVVFFRRYIRTASGKFWWDGLKLRFPIVKGVVACGVYANFSRTLQTLMSNGVPVLRALQITEQTVGNDVVSRELQNVRSRVTDGTSISGPLAAGGVFPVLMTDMLAVGEQTGDMASALGHIGRRYERELDRNIKIMTTALEPILIVVVAILVGFVAYSVISAVFAMTSGMGK